jgi:gamma-glutamylcyclotransferase (GGCT)/AIG2-like uncharacterized protein YtfP
MAVDARTNPALAGAATASTPAASYEPERELDALFVYGSLNDDRHFRLITGQTLPGIPARLPQFRRVHPKNAFAFAIPWRGSHIEGRLLSGLTPALLAKLDDYESAGTLYRRQMVEVEAAGQKRRAWVYLANPESIRPWLERGFAERDRIEAFVERNVQLYLEEKADRCLLIDRKQLALAVTRELLSEEVESLLTHQLLDDNVAPWIIKHEIEKASLPDLEWLEGDSKARRYAGAYLGLAVKFMIFNQIESRFRDAFRGVSRAEERLYEHTLSSLMALKLLVDHEATLRNAMTQLNVDGYRPDFNYPDYAVTALIIAEELWQKERSRTVAEWLEEHRQRGQTPLGAELEFSQLGVRAVQATENEDPLYDSFFYFHDFDLARRGWKLGAHVDDHGFTAARQQRSRGFLELAFGRYRLYGEVSKPATQDPWVLAQLINLAARFIGLKPHSLHLSIQADETVPFKRLENPEFFLCLLLLGGDLREDAGGKLREMRIFQGEILHPETGLYISRLNRHNQRPNEESLTDVVEYQFSRLQYDYDYQPLIMALKGFQRRANPYPFKDCSDCPDREMHQDLETTLKQWAAFPSPVSQSSCQAFLEIVQSGLAEEAAVAGPEYARYVTEVMETIAARLQRRNQRIIDYHTRLRRPEPQRNF